MAASFNPEKGPIKDIYEIISNFFKSTKESLEKLKLNILTWFDLSWLKESAEKKKPDESEDKSEKKDNELNLERLKTFFANNATNPTIDRVDGKNFFEVSYIDKNSGSKVKGIIPFNWNWSSNIYMPGDRSGITETMNNKHFRENITGKNSKKARFIFEWDADKIQNWTQQSARYNNVINNFENMIAPMKSARNNPKITIIWHSRAGRTVDSLIGKYPSIINNYIILDWTYWIYKNVMGSKIPGKIFYTNGGGTKKYVSNYQNKPNLEVSWNYANLGHEQIVSQVLFDDQSTNQTLFA